MSLLSISLGREAEEIAKAFRAAPEQLQLAVRDTVNDTAKFAYAESSRQIRKQLNLAQSYIGSAAAGNRLKISRRATSEDPTAIIEAATRPVSLARFAADRSLARKAGVSVSVKPGTSQFFKRGFIIPLKRGKTITQDQFNLGLAYRLKPGQTFTGSRTAARFSKSDPGLLLLYGPSVDQAFKSIRAQVTPGIEDYMQRTFLRQAGRFL